MNNEHIRQIHKRYKNGKHGEMSPKDYKKNKTGILYINIGLHPTCIQKERHGHMDWYRCHGLAPGREDVTCGHVGC